MELLLLAIIGIPACFLLYFVLMFIPGISKLPTKTLITISAIICLVFAIILYSSLMTPAGDSKSHRCDYCGENTETVFTVGRQDLCYSCYKLYHKGK